MVSVLQAGGRIGMYNREGVITREHGCVSAEKPQLPGTGTINAYRPVDYGIS